MRPEENPEDLKLVTALLTNASVRGAAEVAGVSESTMYRKLREGGFRRQLKEHRLRVFSHALARLQVAAEEAVSTLESLMVDVEAPPAIRIRAAVGVLELAGRGVQPEQLDVQLITSSEVLLETLDG